VSEFTLNGLLGIKNGDTADGMQIEAAWDRAREEYARRGYLEAKLDPLPAYDDQAHTVSYSVSIQRGRNSTLAKWSSREFPLLPSESCKMHGPSLPVKSSTK